MKRHHPEHDTAAGAKPAADEADSGRRRRRRRTRLSPAGLAASLLVTAMTVSGLGAVPAGAAADADDDGPVEAGITVAKVEGMPEDFLTGADVSTVLSLEESGVVFRDESGEPADLFEVLADAGVSSVRVRVWNDPFDEQGRGYGAGNVDTARGVEIGRRATAAGMSVLVDYHYSDFWADPAKQEAPKAWADLTAAERATAAGEFTEDSLEEFRAAGVDVAMVQVGNETNNAVAGVSDFGGRAAIFQAGSESVREVYPQARVAVHFTNPERAGFYAGVAAQLDRYGVDYDVFASSYYPFWHGTLDNLTAVLGDIATTYDKEVMVAETSWVRTLEEGDGEPNVIRTDQSAYPVSVQGQATAVRDVVQAVVDVPGGAGIGVYYWEPAWLPVGPPEQLEANRLLWQEFGSGWATSYVGEYDSTGDADDWGGSGWENQALFDYDGRPLESLHVFDYARTGATAPLAVTSVEQPSLTVADGEDVVLPSTVTVTYNTGAQSEVDVAWSGVQDWVRGPGTYEITGTTEVGPVTATVVVEPRNYVADPGFELGDGAWTTTGTGVGVDGSDPYAGDRSLHFWSAGAYSFTVTQTLTGVPAGRYVLSAQGQGESMGGTVVLQATTATRSAAPFTLEGWREWSAPQVPVTVGEDGVVEVAVDATLPAEAWGTVDEVVLAPVTTSSADRTALRAVLDEVAAVDRSSAAEDELARLDRAREVGEVVLAGSTPTQEDVDAAVALVRAALDGLGDALGTDVSLADLLARDDLGDGSYGRPDSTDFDLLDQAVRRVLAERPGSALAALAQPEQPLTAFLPDDAAFRASLAEVLGRPVPNERTAAARLRSQVPVDLLEEVLLDHVVLGATLESEDVLASDGAELETAGGAVLTLRVGEDGVALLDPEGDVAAVVDTERVDLNRGQVQVAHVVDRLVVTG